MKTYSFYYVGKKIQAFKNLKREKGFSDTIHLGRKFKGYVRKS